MANVNEKGFNICTDEIVCPYCGAEMSNSDEMPDEGTYTCDECGNKFYYMREVETHYDTHRLDADGNIDHFDSLMES